MTVGGRMRVGLVGCGRIARVHRSYLRQLAQVQLVGACDSDEAARAAFVAELPLPSFGSVEELVERGRPDVVHVLTPPATHAPLAMALLDAGVHVLVEKPLALSAAEADGVLAAAERNGRWVTVDHNRYFDPVVQRAARAVEAGRLGRLIGVEVFQGAEAGEAEKTAGGNAQWTTRLPGGMLHNLAPHPLYLMRRFAGRVRGLQVLARQISAGQLEEVRLIAEGEHCLAAVTMSMRAQPFMNRLTLLGTAASAEVNLNNMTLIHRRPRALPKLVGKVWPNLSEAGQLLWETAKSGLAFASGRQRFYPGIGAHLAALYERVGQGGEPPVSAAEGRDVVAWYDEILAQSGVGARPAAMAG